MINGRSVIAFIISLLGGGTTTYFTWVRLFDAILAIIIGLIVTTGSFILMHIYIEWNKDKKKQKQKK